MSVVSFTCRIGQKVLTGLVKEKEKAKEIFDQAVAKGEVAGLLEQAPESSDIFSTKLGNIPAGQTVVVEITYIGELKHHEAEGIRFTIPTKIAPRYGPAASYDASLATQNHHDPNGIKITVDIIMEEGSFIKGVQSPSHPIAVSMGTVSTSDSDPMMSKASATLSLGSTVLEKDFVLIVQCKDVGIPKALLEIHPTIPNHRALMATLVPKFSLPPSRPEIVFVADRSGSMQQNITMLVSAMNVFLKSMPAGVKFNICSFGSHYSFLWPKSQSYTKESLEVATQHLRTFQANMFGTETFEAIRATVEQRFQDIPLEIILLTDGDISRQTELFNYVNKQVELSKGNIRVFPLGIGNGVSHSLIEGLARAGNGFAQAVQNGERLDNSVVRMLRGALSPHITDYTLEVKYEASEEIDFVTEGFKVLLSDASSIKSEKSLRSEKPSPPKATISLFDTSVDPEKDEIKGLRDSKFWLPDIPYPKLQQAPHKIPSLFAFSRTSVYLLMSPDTVQQKPVTVVLRATSNYGPLALEIPVEVLAERGETIHQLAAKKAVQDLEEGRGWIYEAKDQNGIFVKDRYPSCFEELVQKEAVRLGEKFQIAGKWCSFVAVAANDQEIAQKKKKIATESSDDGRISPFTNDAGTCIDDMVANKSDDFDLEEDVQYTPSSEDHEDDGFMVVDPAHTRASRSRRERSVAHGLQYAKRGSGDAGPTNSQNPPTLGLSEPQRLQDYQMQLMLLQQQNKKRVMMARQETDSMSPLVASPAPDFARNQIVPQPNVSPAFGGPSAQATGFDSSAQSPPQNPFGGPTSYQFRYSRLATTQQAQHEQQQQSAPAQGSFSFGAASKQSQEGLFGSSTPSTGSGLFGSSNQGVGGSPFGSAAQPQQTGGLFGQKPLTTGLNLFGPGSQGTASNPFGSTTQQQQTGGLFGNTPQSNLFGYAPPAPPSSAQSTGGGLFGSANAAQQPMSTGLFGVGNQQSTGSSLFGSSSPAASPVPHSIFGSASTTASPAPHSLFGPPPVPQSTVANLFGNFQSQSASPPIIGHGPTNLFGGIQQPQASGFGSVPPLQAQYSGFPSQSSTSNLFANQVQNTVPASVFAPMPGSSPTVIQSQGMYYSPIDDYFALPSRSREADEKRAQNAGAPVRFRRRRMEKEAEAATKSSNSFAPESAAPPLPPPLPIAAGASERFRYHRKMKEYEANTSLGSISPSLFPPVKPSPFNPFTTPFSGFGNGVATSPPGGASPYTGNNLWGPRFSNPQAVPHSLFGQPGPMLKSEERFADFLKIGSKSSFPQFPRNVSPSYGIENPYNQFFSRAPVYHAVHYRRSVDDRLEAPLQSSGGGRGSSRGKRNQRAPSDSFMRSTAQKRDYFNTEDELPALVPPNKSERSRFLSGVSDVHQEPANILSPTTDWSTQTLSSKVLALINLQDFDGFWPSDLVALGRISQILGFEIKQESKSEDEFRVWVTLLVICWLEEKAREEEGTWGLVAEKARAWLDGLGVVFLGSGIEIEARNEVRRY